MKNQWLSLIVLLSVSKSELVNIGDNSYINDGGKWYTYQNSTIGDELLTNEISFRLKPNATLDDINFAQLGFSEDIDIRGQVLNKYYFLKIPANLDPFTLAEDINSNSSINNWQFDVQGKMHVVPTDTYYDYDEEWNQWYLTKIGMENAWTIESGNDDIIVAVIDYGTDYDHEDLDENIWSNSAELNGTSGVDDDGNGIIDDIYGYDPATPDGDPSPDDPSEYHGTWVSGTISAESNNSQGIASVAGGWSGSEGVRIMCLRSSGRKDPFIECVEYAIENGADIINYSGGFSSNYTEVEDAIDDAISAGIIIVASVGNNNTNIITWPAKYEDVIAVGGTDVDDVRWTHGSLGSNYGDELETMAPTGYRSNFALLPGDNYTNHSWEFFGVLPLPLLKSQVW